MLITFDFKGLNILLETDNVQHDLKAVTLNGCENSQNNIHWSSENQNNRTVTCPEMQGLASWHLKALLLK
jgi:hypothetical protein